MAEMPLGTYTGWNVTSNGFYKGQACAFTGGFIRLRRPRPSASPTMTRGRRWKSGILLSPRSTTRQRPS
jgi:hypothetical protein